MNAQKVGANITRDMDVVTGAIKTITQTLIAGRDTHPEDDWDTRQTADNHTVHAMIHLLNTQDTRESNTEPHLEHALTRIAIALYLKEKEE